MRIISSSDTMVDIEMTQEDMETHGFISVYGFDPHVMNNLANAVMPLVAETPLWAGGEQPVTFRLAQGDLGTYILRVAVVDTNNPMAALLSMMAASAESECSCPRCKPQPQYHSQCPVCGQLRDDRTVLVVRVDTLDEVIDF